MLLINKFSTGRKKTLRVEYVFPSCINNRRYAAGKMNKPPESLISREIISLRLNKEQNVNTASHQPHVMDHWRCEARNNSARCILSLSERGGIPSRQKGSVGCNRPRPSLNREAQQTMSTTGRQLQLGQ